MMPPDISTPSLQNNHLTKRVASDQVRSSKDGRAVGDVRKTCNILLDLPGMSNPL